MHMRTTHEVRRTTDHEEIQRWIEERGGQPAIIESTWDGESAILEVDFGESEETLMDISWEEFFRIFDESDQEFLYREEEGGDGEGRFFQFVSQEDE
jgi:hypothetical protein